MKQQLITVSYRLGKLRSKYKLAPRKASTSNMSTGNCGTHAPVPSLALEQENRKNLIRQGNRRKKHIGERKETDS